MRFEECSVMTKKVKEDSLMKNATELGLEDALDIAGTGKYQVFHCALMLVTLASAILEIIGNAFILPAAACDLDLPDNLRGIITSIPNIGVILTAPMWGHAADKFGRKPTLLISALMSGIIGLAAACMPNLTTYAICKFAASLFLACPSSLGFAFAGEMVPRRKRDFALLIVNGFLTLSAIFSPVFAWIILPYSWHYQLSTITLKPWRLLTAAYAIPLILAALWMTQAMESPKFLMSKGRNDEALSVLKHIFMKNKSLPAEEYCVTSLKLFSEEARNEYVEHGSESNQSVFSLLRPPHLKWLALTGFLMFGLFSLLNGLFMFATDTINKSLRGNVEDEGTVCILLNQQSSQDYNSTSLCVDEISNDTFLIMVVTTLLCGAAVLAISVCPLSKRTLLVSMYTTCGVACLLSGLLTNRFIAGVAMSTLQITALGLGPLAAYAVNLFPTSLRGTAVGAVLMCGRLGSVVGANAAGYFLSVACTATFYGFTILIFSCALLSFMLPKDELFKQEELQNEKNNENNQVNR